MMDTAKALECQHCKNTFSQKSSLVRHLKLCTRPRPASLRQKSCRQCAFAKAKCDLQRPNCSRCSLRDIACTYLTAVPKYGPESSTSPPQGQSTTTCSSSSVLTPADHGTNTPDREALEDFLNRVNEPLNAAIEDMPLDVPLPDVLQHCDESVSFLVQGSTDLIHFDPWLLASLNPQDTTPPLAKHSMQTLLRVLRTWPCMLAKGFQFPPIFHQSIKDENCKVAQPLANCCTLTRMWYFQQEGTSSIVQETITRELKIIIANFQTYDETDLLGALQALTIYVIMLVFPTKNQLAIPQIDESIFSSVLQIVYHTARSGLMLQEETDHAIPSWEAWVHITSKRRAVFALYLLHWSYSVYHKLQSFNCSELGFMPAPCAKFLWEARSKEQWEVLYKKWLAQWDGCEYLQYEFGNIKPGVMLGERAQRWLEDADELGILFSSIFNSTDREPEFMCLG